MLDVSLLTDPTYGGVARLVRDARRRADRRAGRAHRLRRAEGDRADDPPEAARRLPDRRVPARPRHARPGRAAREPARRRSAKLLGCTRFAAADACPSRGRRAGHATRTRCPSGDRLGRRRAGAATSSGRTRSTTSATVFDDFQELHGDRLSARTPGDRRRRRPARRPAGDRDRPPEGPHDERDGRAQLRHAEPRGLPQGAAADAPTPRSSACRSSPSSTRRAPTPASGPRSAARRSRSPRRIC